MEFYTEIRKLFTPIQPTINLAEGNVSYLEFLPDLKLQDYIYCYWELKTTEELKGAFHYKVVADGCIDIFFELDNSKESYVMGFCKKYTAFDLANSFHYIGIRFFPTVFPLLFNINVIEISNKAEKLINISPQTANFIHDTFQADQTIHQIKQLLDLYFVAYVLQNPIHLDARLSHAIVIILKNFGVLNVEKDLDVGISSRQLRRLFEFYIGDTPKTFCKVVRFQNILKAKPSTQSLKNNKLFYDQGYYDQSHFIKDFKNLYGITPNKAFNR